MDTNTNEVVQKEKFKLTSLEKKWILYDVANSAYVLLVCTLVPIYFNMLGEKGNLTSVEYLAYWGYANSVATIISAVAGPLLGTAADREGRKKKIFAIIIAIGSAACLAFGFVREWLAFLIIFVISRVAFNLGCVIYDSTLSDVTTEERIDDVSSQGYAFGYIGSCIPFIICLLMYIFLSPDAVPGLSKGIMSTENAMALGFALTAAWWFFVSLPILKSYKQKYFITKEEAENEHFFATLGNTIKSLGHDRKVGLFLLAFFFYIDGVYTIIDMATAYGTSLGLDTTMLLLALLVTQFVAFPSAIIIGKLSKKYNVTTLISVCIIAYFCIACYAFFLKETYQFWILAVVVGMFQGGVQALSRSYFTKIIPSEKSGEYFGLYDIIGKGATFVGTMLISVVAQATGQQNIGVASISVLFIIGFVLFRMSIKDSPKSSSAETSEEV